MYKSGVNGRDVNENLRSETETRPRHLVVTPRRDRDAVRERDVRCLVRENGALGGAMYGQYPATI